LWRGIQILPSRNTNAIILGIVFAGIGHIYLGFRMRGILWLVGAIVIAIWNVFTMLSRRFKTDLDAS
jgi:TM2 domain-containing membrane protein YozV